LRYVSLVLVFGHTRTREKFRECRIRSAARFEGKRETVQKHENGLGKAIGHAAVDFVEFDLFALRICRPFERRPHEFPLSDARRAMQIDQDAMILEQRSRDLFSGLRSAHNGKSVNIGLDHAVKVEGQCRFRGLTAYGLVRQSEANAAGRNPTGRYADRNSTAGPRIEAFRAEISRRDRDIAWNIHNHAQTHRRCAARVIDAEQSLQISRRKTVDALPMQRNACRRPFVDFDLKCVSVDGNRAPFPGLAQSYRHGLLAGDAYLIAGVDGLLQIDAAQRTVVQKKIAACQYCALYLIA